MTFFLGQTKEYIRLNDTIRDYVQRTKGNLPERLKSKIKEHVKKFLSNLDKSNADVSDFMYTVRQAMVDGDEIPEYLLIPSHFLKTMTELYQKKKKYTVVISLADRVLSNSKYIDSYIIKDIKYWLCLSLARLRDERFLKEVQYIDGPDHNFLFGFYYRQKGQNDKAIERLKKVLDDSPDFYRAKRELVNVYLTIEEFENAFLLAKENYENDRNNPYHLQSYIRCLIKLYPSQVNLIESLLSNLKSIKSEKATEMYCSSNAQYLAVIKNHKIEALNLINKAIFDFPENIYPLLTKFDICLKFYEKDELESTMDILEKKFNQNYYQSIIIFRKVKLLVFNGKITEALNLLSSKLNRYLPEYTVKKLRDEINKQRVR